MTFSGTGDPPGTVQATVVAHSGDYDGPVVDQGQAVVGRHGTWQVPIGTGDLDHLYVEVDIEPTSMQHELSGGGRMRFPPRSADRGRTASQQHSPRTGRAQIARRR